MILHYRRSLARTDIIKTSDYLMPVGTNVFPALWLEASVLSVQIVQEEKWWISDDHLAFNAACVCAEAAACIDQVNQRRVGKESRHHGKISKIPEIDSRPMSSPFFSQENCSDAKKLYKKWNKYTLHILLVYLQTSSKRYRYYAGQ